MSGIKYESDDWEEEQDNSENKPGKENNQNQKDNLKSVEISLLEKNLKDFISQSFEFHFKKLKEESFYELGIIAERNNNQLSENVKFINQQKEISDLIRDSFVDLSKEFKKFDGVKNIKELDDKINKILSYLDEDKKLQEKVFEVFEEENKAKEDRAHEDSEEEVIRIETVNNDKKSIFKKLLFWVK